MTVEMYNSEIREVYHDLGYWIINQSHYYSDKKYTKAQAVEKFTKEVIKPKQPTENRKYNMDCVNDTKIGSVWGTITELETIDIVVEKRGRWEAEIEFCGLLKDYSGRGFAFFKDRKTENNYFVEVFK